MRLLLLEDERRLAELVRGHLARAGFAVDVASTLEDARAWLGANRCDAAIVDRLLPDGDGIALVRAMRARGDTTPVLLLTARDAVADRVAGLNSGADDYLVKPFAAEELVARVRALLRRPGAALGRSLRLGNLALDTAERSATVNGNGLVLPRRELAALECLLRRAGRVVTKRNLLESLYGEDDEPASNAVPVHVHGLRRALQLAGASAEVVTFRGLGYMIRRIGA